MSWILWAIAIVFYALSQAAAHGKIKDNPDAKYKQPKVPGKGLYYSLFRVRYQEKFPGSATIFTFVTDKYHLFQAVFKLAAVGAIYTHESKFGLWDLPLLWVEFGVVFTVVYGLCSKRGSSPST